MDILKQLSRPKYFALAGVKRNGLAFRKQTYVYIEALCGGNAALFIAEILSAAEKNLPPTQRQQTILTLSMLETWVWLQFNDAGVTDQDTPEHLDAQEARARAYKELPASEAMWLDNHAFALFVKEMQAGADVGKWLGTKKKARKWYQLVRKSSPSRPSGALPQPFLQA